MTLSVISTVKATVKNQSVTFSTFRVVLSGFNSGLSSVSITQEKQMISRMKYPYCFDDTRRAIAIRNGFVFENKYRLFSSSGSVPESADLVITVACRDSMDGMPSLLLRAMFILLLLPPNGTIFCVCFCTGASESQIGMTFPLCDVSSSSSPSTANSRGVTSH